MSDRSANVFDALARPALYFAILLIVLPLADYATNVWPYRFGSVQWRFGAVGLLAGFHLTPLLGLALALLIAVAEENTGLLRGIGIVSLVAAVILVLVQPLFALDWIQFRASAQQEAVASVDIGSIKAVVKHLLVAVCLGWMGRVAWREAKRQAGRRPRRDTTPIVRTDGS